MMKGFGSDGTACSGDSGDTTGSDAERLDPQILGTTANIAFECFTLILHGGSPDHLGASVAWVQSS
jgi:hypothetical protein